MSSLKTAIEGIEASAAPYVEAVTFRIEDGRVETYFTMTDDENAPPFARVVEAVPDLRRRLDAEIRAAGALYVPLGMADYADADDADGFIFASRSAPGGSPH